MNHPNLLSEIEENGYYVAENMLGEEPCKQLLWQAIHSIGEVPDSFVYSSSFRRHTPQEMTISLFCVLRQLLNGLGPGIHDFFGYDPQLVELSSIITFPNAESQHFHHDHFEEGKKILSFFIYLLDADETTGALRVKPGSHKIEKNQIRPKHLSIPRGSVVIIDGKLEHCGGSITVNNAIRPVVYFSFGDLDIEGSAYSLRPNLHCSHTLSNFIIPQHIHRKSVPRIRPGLRLLTDLRRSNLVLCSDRSQPHEHQIESEARYHLDNDFIVGKFGPSLTSDALIRFLASIESYQGMDIEALCSQENIGVEDAIVLLEFLDSEGIVEICSAEATEKHSAIPDMAAV